MREKVRLISQKIAARKQQRGGVQTDLSSCSSSSHSDNKKKTSPPHRHESRSERRRRKGARFEGDTRVSHLVKQRKFKSGAAADPEKPEGEEDEKAKQSQEQDNYVLAKLFKKSGVHSAVRHDVVVEGGGADFALVEGEAERIAKDAVEKLRESRRQCFRAESGMRATMLLHFCSGFFWSQFESNQNLKLQHA